MSEYPDRLKRLLDVFSLIEDRQDRIEMLIGIADRFRPVPQCIATRPFPERNRVPHCESEGLVLTEKLPDQSLKFHFAVENPQGISAMATAVILDETLSGTPPEQVAIVPSDIIYSVFGNELSMGTSMGLMALVSMIQVAARTSLAQP